MVSRSKEASWFTNPRPNPNAILRLFCFPYAGGSSLIYRDWPEQLPSTVEICLAQLPGRGVRIKDPAFTRLMAMVEEIGKAILPYLDKPFAFMGHSMGAMIGFELARSLRREHRLKPVCLFITGRRAPQCPNKDRITHALPDAELLEELRRLNGTPKEVLDHPELMELMLPLLRADFAVVETYLYSPEPPLDCPISVIGGLQDKEVTRDQLEAWSEQTLSDFKLRMVEGDHFFINTSQAILLQLIAQDLRQLTLV